MARTNSTIKSFSMRYVTEFESIIRGHHVYQHIWTAAIDDILYAKPDNREEARNADPYVVGIYLPCETLIGHVPIEISQLMYHFLEAHPDNRLMVKINGKRRKEVGLVLPAKYMMYTANKEIAEVLNSQLIKLKNSNSKIQIGYNEKVTYFKVPVFDVLQYGI
jgi:hypothetical protein